MSWKLIFALSLSGVLMGLATVFVIPHDLEPHFWLGIFVVTGVVIAKYAPGKYFVHGLCVSLVASVWVILAHVALFDRYIVIHGRIMAMVPPIASPHVLMALAGGAAGVAAGLALGFYSWASSKLIVSAQSEYAGW
jgi:hypothetical protein